MSDEKEKKAGGFLDGVFTHSETSLAKRTEKLVAQKEGKTAEEIAKIEEKIAKVKEIKVGSLNKMTLGALAGAAAVLAVVVAGTGNKGPGEKSAQVRDEQQAAAMQKDAAPGVA